MRELKYAVEGKAANLQTFAVDEPGKSGACHEYIIAGPDGLARIVHKKISFQNGPIIGEGGRVNGIQNEDLLAILIDRLEGFQRGIYACDENKAALQHCRHALEVLNARTRERIMRKVEGTHTV